MYLFVDSLTVLRLCGFLSFVQHRIPLKSERDHSDRPDADAASSTSDSASVAAVCLCVCFSLLTLMCSEI
jgi:hypothetical protein